MHSNMHGTAVRTAADGHKAVGVPAHEARDLALLDARLEWHEVTVDEVLLRDRRREVVASMRLTGLSRMLHRIRCVVLAARRRL